MSSNYTHREYYHANGTLSSDRIEQLLDREDTEIRAENVEPHLTEAFGTWPSEDFLHTVTERLQRLVKQVRGNNQQQLLEVIEQLGNIATDVNNSSDYGRDELSQAIAALKINS